MDIDFLNNLSKQDLIKIAKALNTKGNMSSKKEDIIKNILEKKNKKKISKNTKDVSIKKTENKKLNDIYSLPKRNKIIAIGDLHGDLEAAIKSLKLAGVIKKSVPNIPKNLDLEWIGGDTVVVQIGDQIDRVRPSNLVNNLCPEDDDELHKDEGSDLKIISLFCSLHKKAIKDGGAVISCIGNHELMNILGDFRYVSPREFNEFGNYFNAKKTQKKLTKFPYGYKERKEAFKPGGILAKKLAECYYSVFQVGSWIFVHGGISPELAKKYTIKSINDNIKHWLLGNTDPSIKKAVDDLYHNDDDTFSPFWCRLYSDIEEWNSEKEDKFKRTIKILNHINNPNEEIKGMIMGHTPQYNFDRGINSSCNEKLWRIDVGVSKAFGPSNNNINRKVSVLCIENDTKCKIIREL